MLLPRRQFLGLAAGAAALSYGSNFGITQARAQAYPSRPVRIVIGFPAGSGVDVMARLVSPFLAERLGQPVVIENRAGAGSNIATESVVRSAPDGHTLLWVGPPVAINATLYEKLNYVFLRDITPVAGINLEPSVLLADPKFEVKTIPELIAYAKANPGKINMASVGNGSMSHVAGELFKMMTGTDMLHVPYVGGPPAMTDLIGGRVQIVFVTPSASMALIRSGQVRPIGVGTTERVAILPEVAMIKDHVPGFEANYFYGVGAPRNTPADIVNRLNKDINSVLTEPKVKERFADLGATPLIVTPAQFADLIAQETEKWGKVIRHTGIKIN